MSSIEAKLFDGTILEFPEGTDPGVIQRVVKEQTAAKRGGSMGATAGPAAPASTVQQRIEETLGPGTSPMADPAAVESDAMRSDRGTTMGQDLMSAGSYAGGLLQQAGLGAIEGVTNIIGLPQSVAQIQRNVGKWGAEQLGAPQGVIDAMDYITPLATIAPNAQTMQRGVAGANDFVVDAIGAPGLRAEPGNAGERFVNRVFEEVGAAALPIAGMIGIAARRGLPAIRESGSAISRMFLEPAAVNPARFAGREATVAAGAGTGAATANTMVDRDTTAGQVADFAGAVAGAGATGIGASLARGVRDLSGALFNRSGYVDDVVRDAVVDRLAEAGGLQTAIGQAPDTTPLIEAIQGGPRIGRVVPGVKETLADRTQNPGIASLEYSRQTGPNSGLFNTRRQDNAAAIDDTLTAMAPEGSASQLRNALDIERSRRIADASTSAQNAAEDARRAVEPLAPVGTPAARGNTIRSALEQARETARAKTADAYANANVTGNNISANELVDTIETSIGRLTEAEQNLLPESLIDRIRKLGSEPAAPINTGLLDASGNPITRAPPAPEPVRLKEAADLRTELNRLAAAASADPRAERGGRNAARVLSQLSDDVDNFIMRNLTPDERQALETARGTKFDEAERFSRQGDPVAAALARNEGGMPRMRDENVARTFTNTQNMDRLLAQADTPEVRAAIRSELLSGADTSRADRIQSFIDANSEQISRFPGLQDELTRAVGARTAEAEATGRLAGMERELGTPERRGTSTVGRYLNYGDAQSERAIREVINAPDPAKAADELLTFVGDDPAAVAGARKSYWDLMESQSRRKGETTAGVDGRQPWMPRNLKAFLDDPKNRAVAERFYKDSPEHIENVRIIAEALQGLDTRNAGRVPNTSGTAQGVLPSAETIGSRLFAYQRGQVGGAWLITSLAAIAGRRAVRGARGEAIERMLDQALLNPDDAALLLRDNNPANRAALARRAKVWFGNQASQVMNALSGEEQQDDTMEAIGGR